MKELHSVNANFFSVWTENENGNPPESVAHAEVIILMKEPCYAMADGGAVERGTEISQCRFVAPPEGLRKLAEVLRELADEAERLGMTLKA